MPATAPAGPAPLDVPGLTMSRALTYLPGRTALFERVLRLFASQYPQGLDGLVAAVQGADWRQVQRLLHSLRGACGAIGATALLARAGTLEASIDVATAVAAHPGRRPADAATLAGQARLIDTDLRALVTAIQAALPDPDGGASPGGTADNSPLHKAMDALAAQLRVADFAANAAFRALTAPLQAALGQAAVQPVADALARHDYDGALLALHGLRHPTGGAQPA